MSVSHAFVIVCLHVYGSYKPEPLEAYIPPISVFPMLSTGLALARDQQALVGSTLSTGSRVQIPVLLQICKQMDLEKLSNLPKAHTREEVMLGFERR